MIAVVNYGVGNLKSIAKAIEYVGGKVEVTDDPKVIREASAVVFPGVGAFRTAVERLNEFRDVIDFLTVPILGICLGMQLFATESTEGGTFSGLNYVPGRVVKFPPNVGKVPHMGWNTIRIERESEILDGVENGSYVYFVHSYYMETSKEYVLTTTEYGMEFVSGIEKDNYIGFQFHPEKSGKVGLKILKNFLKISKC